MATIVHFRHPSSAATPSAEQVGAASLFMAELEILKRRIGSYRRLIAECAAQLSELEQGMHALLEAQTQLRELHGAQSEARPPITQRETESLGCRDQSARACADLIDRERRWTGQARQQRRRVHGQAAPFSAHDRPGQASVSRG